MLRPRLLLLSPLLALVVLYPIFAESPATSPKVPKKLLEQRLEAARSVYRQRFLRLQGGTALPSELFGWSARWLDAELALCEMKNDRVKALRDHLDRTREVEKMTAALARAGQGRQGDADAATYYRLQAEIRLIEAGIEPHPAKEAKRQTANP